MVARVATVAFHGIDVIPVDVQVQLASGLPAFTMVGLPDKIVNESRERVRAALTALGMGLPAKRITINLSPADILKEGSHFDLPIALGLIVAAGAIPAGCLDRCLSIGELALDGRLTGITGVLPAAMYAYRCQLNLACPAANGPEATLAGAGLDVLAAASLLDLVHYFQNNLCLPKPGPIKTQDSKTNSPDIAEIHGQKMAKRAMEIAAAGGHHMLMIGPPGAGKTMLAERMPGLLPPMDAEEALEVTLIRSITGMNRDIGLITQRPFRNPHHSASLAALVGGGQRVRPGEVSLAHSGILFLDELAEFSRMTLDALRQPMESGEVVIARANAHIVYPARFQLVGAMNPCRCGMIADPTRACSRAPRCGLDYQGRISGPLYDRIDLYVEILETAPSDLSHPSPTECSTEILERVLKARYIQAERYRDLCHASGRPVRINSDASSAVIDVCGRPDRAGQALLTQASENLKLSARAYYRTLRVARSIADLENSEAVRRIHVAEALVYRRL